MNRRLPLAVCFITGIIMLIQFFIPHPLFSKKIYNEALRWAIVISAFTLIIGIESLIRLHANKIRRKVPGWGYSVIAIVMMIFVAVVGIWKGIGEGSLFIKIFRYVLAPLNATMFSMLAFFMASAAYRSFRARTPEAVLLLCVALFVMYGRVPIGHMTWEKIPDIVEWILRYPRMGAQRGILIGVGLGVMATSLKMLLGIERQWLGGAGGGT